MSGDIDSIQLQTLWARHNVFEFMCSAIFDGGRAVMCAPPGKAPMRYPFERYKELSTAAVGLALALLLLVPSAAADTVTLTFEGFPDSTSLTNQYANVTFTNATIITSGISLNEFELPPYSGTNVVFDDGGTISVSFASPITSFAAYFTYYEPLTLDGFNASNTEVASATSAYSINVGCDPPPLGCLGDPGSSPNELLQLSSPGGIVSVSIIGDPLGDSLVMDDLTYSTSTTVPEPASIGLLALCVTCIGLWKASHEEP